jgi:bifunctional non-homologous end joining protein LigD
MIRVDPMLAESTDALPGGPGWLFEPKYDGMRALAYVEDAGVTLLSRKGHSQTRQFPEIVETLRTLHAAVGRDFVLDGEIVAAVSVGFAGFQMLQSRIGALQPFKIRMLALRNPAAFVSFDVLEVGGQALLTRPLFERREVLEALLAGAEGGLRIAHQGGDGRVLLARARAELWEGVVAKRADSRYLPGHRGPGWLKYKDTRRQEFVVAGFTATDAPGRPFAALVLGYYAGGSLVYAGCAGSGFTQRELARAEQRLRPLQRTGCPFQSTPDLDAPVHWVEPREVAEVRFQDWTDDGRIRFPVHLGFRQDKRPEEVVRET